MAEKDYIEREALLDDLDAAMKNSGMGYVVGQTMKRYVKRVPAADVAPVVHARWITEDNTEGYRGDPHCTACKYILPDEAVYGCTPGVDDYFYCPNCGAKMDGGKHG